MLHILQQINQQMISSFDTVFTADCCEFLPDDRFGVIFVCGTYQLVVDEATAAQRKIGRMYLFDASNDNELKKPLQTIDTVAILDIKWLGGKKQTYVFIIL